MHPVMFDPNKRLRTPAAILASATHVLAEHTDASMSDIATAAGVGRATLYRYFPTREALLEALAAQAHGELAARIADAGLERVPVPEALERMIRAFLAVGDCYVVLARGHEYLNHDHREQDEELEIVGPIRAVFQRGIDDGVLRGDLGAEGLMGLCAGVVLAACQAELTRTLGVEETAATVTAFFLDGARRRD